MLTDPKDDAPPKKDVRTDNCDTARAGASGSCLRQAVQIVFAFILMPVLLLVGFEFALRTAGFGQSTRPYVKRSFDGNTFYAPNNAYFQQFYSLPVEQLVNWDDFEFQVASKKPEGVCRILVAGGSTANGQPPDAAYSFGRVLQAMLAARFSDVQFELHCIAFPMANSNVMWPAVQECSVLQPDLLVIYTGDNEVSGPFGAGSKITESFLWRVPLIRANIRLTNLRLAQLAGGRSGRAFVRPQDMEMFFATLDPDGAKMHTAEEHLRQNLRDMCRAGVRAGAGVILCTVGSNIRDWGPSASEHRTGLSPEELARWQGFYDAGIAKEQAAAYSEAVATYEQAAAIDETYAELRFRMARCLWNLGQFEQAKGHFVAARERDFHQIRASNRVNELIRRVASELSGRGVRLADCARQLEDDSPHGVVGREFYFDNAHLTFDGNYEVACAVFEQAVSALPARVRAEGAQSTEAVSKEECVRRLALTPWIQRNHMDSVLQLLEKEKYDKQLGFAETMEWCRKLQEQFDVQAGPKGMEETIEAYRAALGLGDDAILRLRYVQALLKHGRAADAVAEAQPLAEHFAYRRGVQRWLGNALKDAGQIDAAIEALRKAVSCYPDDSGAYSQLGAALAVKQDFDGAIAAYRKAGLLNRQDASVPACMGDVFMRQKNYQEAAQAFRTALKLNPDIKYSRAQLVRALVEAGDLDAARNEAEQCKAAGVDLPKDLADRLVTVNAVAP